MIKKISNIFRRKKKPEILNANTFEQLEPHHQKEIYDRMKRIFLRDLKTLLEAWNVEFYYNETITLNFNDFNYSEEIGQFDIDPCDSHYLNGEKNNA